MLNQVIIVGRVARIEADNSNQAFEKASISLAVTKSYKNSDGEYETIFVPITLYNQVAKNTLEYVKKGDVIGIKGTINSKSNQISINVERVTFLSSKKD